MANPSGKNIGCMDFLLNVKPCAYRGTWKAASTSICKVQMFATVDVFRN